jgi:hypothetical protein
VTAQNARLDLLAAELHDAATAASQIAQERERPAPGIAYHAATPAAENITAVADTLTCGCAGDHALC